MNLSEKLAAASKPKTNLPDPEKARPTSAASTVSSSPADRFDLNVGAEPVSPHIADLSRARHHHPADTAETVSVSSLVRAVEETNKDLDELVERAEQLAYRLTGLPAGTLVKQGGKMSTGQQINASRGLLTDAQEQGTMLHERMAHLRSLLTTIEKAVG